jgi:hypothetical protein
MDAEGNQPILINQLAIEQSIPESQREAFREDQQRRGFRLVTDLSLEEVQQERESFPILPETQPEPESQAARESSCAANQREARELIERVKSADPNSEEFWEGRIALLFGRDLEGRRLPESELEEVHAEEEELLGERGEEENKQITKFWSEHP